MDLRIFKLYPNLPRSAYFDLFFSVINYVDSLEFIMLLSVVVWTLINRKIGIKLFYILILSGAVNSFLKTVFDLPRPCQLDPSLTVSICYPNGGFPSGGAQSAAIYFGLLLIETKKRIYWLWGGLFALLLCFSRIYLGLHFFIHIIGGLAVGALLVLIYWKIFPLFESRYKLAAILFPFIIFPLTIRAYPALFWITLGAGIGLQFPYKKSKNRVLEAAIVLAGTALCLAALRFTSVFPIQIACFMGFWVSYMS